MRLSGSRPPQDTVSTQFMCDSHRSYSGLLTSHWPAVHMSSPVGRGFIAGGRLGCWLPAQSNQQGPVPHYRTWSGKPAGRSPRSRGTRPESRHAPSQNYGAVTHLAGHSERRPAACKLCSALWQETSNVGYLPVENAWKLKKTLSSPICLS